jgi:hypothetical protein
MKDQKGKWMAVKVFPHSVGNIKSDIRPSGKVTFRWPKGETRDPYYIVGTFNANTDNKHMLWIEIQQASHPFGKGRTCESCHKEKQVAASRWEYMDDQGSADTFTGGYRIIAGKDGLKITDMKSDQAIKVADGSKLEDFASWVYFSDKWQMPGDFSIKAEKKKYVDYLSLSKKVDREIKFFEVFFKDRDAKSKRKYMELKGSVLHNQDGAMEMMREFKENKDTK